MRNAECGMRNFKARSSPRDAHPDIPHSTFRIPHSCDEDRHDLVRLRDEPYDVSSAFEHQRRGLTLVRAHAVRATHAAAEAPSPRDLPPRRVITTHHERRAPLRRLDRGSYESRALERDVDRRGGELDG